MCLAQGPQHSDAGEARTRSPSVSGQALFYCTTALPQKYLFRGLSEYKRLKTEVYNEPVNF